MLVRSVLVDLDDVPTLIFDEVDAGIGGLAGVAVGRRPRTSRSPAGRRGDPPAADRVVRGPAHPVRKDGGTASVEVLGRRREGRGALEDARRTARERRRRRPRRGAAVRGRRMPGRPLARPTVAGRHRRGLRYPSARGAAPGHRLRPPKRPSADVQAERSKDQGGVHVPEQAEDPAPAPLRRPKPQGGLARVDSRTKRLVQRVAGGDRGDRPRGPRRGLGRGAGHRRGRRRGERGLVRSAAGTPTWDRSACSRRASRWSTRSARCLPEGPRGRGAPPDGDRVYAGDRLVGVGIRQSTATIRESMGERSSGWPTGSRRSRATRSTTCSASTIC